MDAELISHLGNDLTVVNAARVSFDKESEWESITPAGPVENVLKDKDVKLIKYLAKHNHFTPFTHCMITLRETVPIFVARQRFKHTIGFSYNEVSRRYVNDTPEFYTPDTWRFKADNVKQGSHYTGLTSQEVNGKLRDKEEANGLIMSPEEIYDDCLRTYKQLLSIGVCAEQARMVLPQSMYTSYYVTGSLAAFARAYKLRSDDLAQIEIQNLAERWNNIIAELYPVSWEALTK
jgi:thymidylate synthase (FAD)